MKTNSITYYPFGLKHRKYNNLLSDIKFNPSINNRGLIPVFQDKTYKYKYQGQERQDELNLNWDSYKWRNYDFAIGRFMSVDPLAEDYPYNSTYAFQENKMGMGRELEGLELVLWGDVEVLDKETAQSVANVITTAESYLTDVGDGILSSLQEELDGYANLVTSVANDIAEGDVLGALEATAKANSGMLGSNQLSDGSKSLDLSDGNAVGKTAGSIISAIVTKKGKVKNSGGSGKQARLKELGNDPKVSSADRGWIKQEVNSVKRGSLRKGKDGKLRPQKNLRNPPGKDLAHPYKKRAKDGHSYKDAKLKNKADHKTEHKIHGYK